MTPAVVSLLGCLSRARRTGGDAVSRSYRLLDGDTVWVRDPFPFDDVEDDADGEANMRCGECGRAYDVAEWTCGTLEICPDCKTESLVITRVGGRDGA